jgi:hypothetical protein
MTSNFFLINYADIEKTLQEATAALRQRSEKSLSRFAEVPNPKPPITKQLIIAL